MISSVKLSRRRFRAKPARKARAATRVGTRISFRLSEKATVRIEIQRSRKGRYRRVTVIRRSGRAGKNAVVFSGRVGRRALPAGSYRLRVTATDRAGNRSTVRTARFRIVRR